MHSHRGRVHLATVVVFTVALSSLSPQAGAADPEVERLHRELASTRAELSGTRDELATTRAALAALTSRVDAMQATAPAAASAAAMPAQSSATARIAPVNADNPAISFVVDTALASDSRSSYDSIGYPQGADFSLKNAELFISAPIDPFLRGYASINGTSDEGFDVEEAALVTTALPWNLTVKGGRFFADIGRLPHWHDEGLPFVDRPPSIDRLIGGEAGSEGLELSWLVPSDTFLELTGGVYDTVGAENLEDLNDNGFFGRRSTSELSYLARPHSYLDLTDTLNAEFGGTWVGVPSSHERNLFGVDLTLRHQPGTSGLYQGLVWGSEWLWNNQLFTERDATGVVIDQQRLRRQGGYSYLEAFFARRYSAGARFDYSEAVDGVRDLARTVSIFATWKPSEFQRLRLQLDDSWGDQRANQRVTLQWTAFLGSHSHGFAQR